MLIKSFRSQRLCLNLSAPSLYGSNSLPILKEVYEKADCILGNFDEFKSFYKNISGKDAADIDVVVRELTMGEKIIVCTNGGDPIVYSDGMVFGILPVEKIESKNIDTCGAGDAFAAGFLSSYYNDRAGLENNIQVGHQWAKEFIEQNSKLLKDLT
jgi:sugar/nucleoside kinase (ribokinase family)